MERQELRAAGLNLAPGGGRLRHVVFDNPEIASAQTMDEMAFLVAHYDIHQDLAGA